MENATKALLIAAAILIAIVLISIGVFVLRQGNDAMSTVDMSEAQILAFNSNFEPFAGTQRGSQVNALITRVNNSNAKQDTLQNITLTAPDTIKTTAFYIVKIEKKNNNVGIVDTITVTEASSTD